jgi:hypothetical protein
VVGPHAGGGWEPSVDFSCVHGVLGSSCILGAFKSYETEAAGARGIFSEGGAVGVELMRHGLAVAASPVHGDERVKNFAVPAKGIDKDVFVCAPGQVADVAAVEGEGEERRERAKIGKER